MTNYKNFVRDFPKRCKDVLLMAEELAIAQDREVTLMLMVASAALSVPYERLRPEAAFVHSANDRSKYADAANKFDSLLNQRFLNSPLWEGQVGSWFMGSLRSASGTPDSWQELINPTSVLSSDTIKSVFNILRNGLAHGNLYTRPERKKEPIEALVFVSGGYNKIQKKKYPYKYIQVSPQDFRCFLLNWVKFLAGLNIPEEVVLEVLEPA